MLQGSSFFALKDPTVSAPLTSQSQAILTRAGAFRVDGDRYLVNPDGYQVVDTAGNPIQFSDNAAAIGTAVATFQADPSIAALSAALIVDLAAADAVVLAYVPPLTSTQTAVVALQADATAKNTAAVNAIAAFNAAPTAANADSAAVALKAALATMQTYASGTVTPVTATTAVAPAVSPAAAFDMAYGALTAQEGNAFAKVSKIGSDGTITYLDKAGNTKYYTATNIIGSPTTTGIPGEKIAVINPSNPGALDKMGGTLFRISAGAGVPTGVFSVSANSANGTSEKIYSNSLEQSNVDMAGQFVKMILTQRAYSANSKTITTADEMTQEVINLKR
jgi:flagellar hook protein FlgE